MTLVFLHHFGGSSRTWQKVIGGLPDRRCLAPDLNGFGESGSDRAFTVDDYADEVTEFVRPLGPYTLIGHSMSGKIALALASRRPPGLASLVLVAPSPPTPEPMEDEARAHLLASHGDRASAEATVRKITAHPLPAPLYERTVEDILRVTPRAWSAWLEGGSREDISARMPRVEVPTLILAGSDDPIVPPDLLRQEVLARIAGARMAVVPGVGHLLPLEAPDLIANALRLNA